MSVGKKLRFDVFKRDGFTCQYCGKTPPGITLEVDHIQPVSKNGTDDIDNLITACFDCNRGKRDYLINDVPKTLQEKAEKIKEARLQYEQYQKILIDINDKEQKEINQISQTFNVFFVDYSLTEQFKNNTVKYFIRKLGLYEVDESMKIACSKINDAYEVTRYFCGICHNKIKSL